MLLQSKEIIERHVKTHTQRSAEDASAVNTLETFLDFDGRINCDFSKRDKWPNTDGFFELVPDPNLNRRPVQTFFVQIKGTHNYTEKDGILKYSLQSLAFPAFIATNTTLDPGILFVVLNPDIKGKKEFFGSTCRQILSTRLILIRIVLQLVLLQMKKYLILKRVLFYGAAGTGKTLLLNYISNLMSKQKKLFLTKTHTAKQNLQRRIDNPGADSDFVSIDSFTKKVNLPDYDVIFVDECSTIDNRTMRDFLGKISQNTFLVLAGDIHQIESIDFGNWFFYAKNIINTYGSNVELLNTWRTKDPNIVSLWDDMIPKKQTLKYRTP